MLLLDITVSTPIIVLVIGAIITVFLTLTKFVWNIVEGKHNEAMKRLDRIVDEQKVIEQDLKPLTMKIAEHTIEIQTIRDKLHDQEGWLTAHGNQLQLINKTLRTAS